MCVDTHRSLGNPRRTTPLHPPLHTCTYGVERDNIVRFRGVKPPGTKYDSTEWVSRVVLGTSPILLNHKRFVKAFFDHFFGILGVVTDREGGFTDGESEETA